MKTDYIKTLASFAADLFYLVEETYGKPNKDFLDDWNKIESHYIPNSEDF